MGKPKHPLKEEWPRICHNNDNIYHLMVTYYINKYYANHYNLYSDPVGQILPSPFYIRGIYSLET